MVLRSCECPLRFTVALALQTQTGQSLEAVDVWVGGCPIQVVWYPDKALGDNTEAGVG